MKKTKFLLVAILLVILPILGAATSQQSQTTTVSGKITATIVFQQDEVSAAKDWLSQTKIDALTALNNQIAGSPSSAQKDILLKAKAGLENINTDDMISVNKNGTADLTSNLPNVQVSIGGKTVTTDESGNYTVKGVTEGSNQIQVSAKNQPIISQTVNTTNSNEANINSSISTSDVNSAINNMGQMTGNAQSEKFYSKISNLGPQKGTHMIILSIPKTYQIVERNKAYKDVSGSTFDASKSDLSKFPFNKSDCARNIALGEMASRNFFANLVYSNSYNCYYESITHVMNSETGKSGKNIYCNGKNKGGGHYNCSWFNGVGNSQRLHTGSK